MNLHTNLDLTRNLYPFRPIYAVWVEISNRWLQDSLPFSPFSAIWVEIYNRRLQESLPFRPFSAIWVENNGGTEALLAAPSAFSAKLVVFLTTTLIKKERPFSLEIFRHTRHNGYNGHLLIAA